MASFYGGGGGGMSNKQQEQLLERIYDKLLEQSFKFKIVDELPSEDISATIIYLIKTGEEENNLYTEYIFIDNNWQTLGPLKLDLSDYLKSSDIINLLSQQKYVIWYYIQNDQIKSSLEPETLLSWLEVKNQRAQIPNIIGIFNKYGNLHDLSLNKTGDNKKEFYYLDSFNVNTTIDESTGDKITHLILIFSFDEEKNENSIIKNSIIHNFELINFEYISQSIELVKKSLISGTQNVQADWNATSGAAEILNKPTLGTAAAKDVGIGSNQVAAGNHNHSGVYAPALHFHDDRYYIKTEIDNNLSAKQNALTAGDNVSIATVNGILTISANTPAPTDAQVQTAVDNYLDQNGVVFNTSAEIMEVLND